MANYREYHNCWCFGDAIAKHHHLRHWRRSTFFVISGRMIRYGSFIPEWRDRKHSILLMVCNFVVCRLKEVKLFNIPCNQTKGLKNHNHELYIRKAIYSGQGNLLRPVGLPRFLRFLVFCMIRLMVMDESTGLEWGWQNGRGHVTKW